MDPNTQFPLLWGEKWILGCLQQAWGEILPCLDRLVEIWHSDRFEVDRRALVIAKVLSMVMVTSLTLLRFRRRARTALMTGDASVR